MVKAIKLNYITLTEFEEVSCNLSEKSVLYQKKVYEIANILFLPADCLMHYGNSISKGNDSIGLARFLIDTLLRENHEKPILIISSLADSLGLQNPDNGKKVKEVITEFKKQYINSTFWFNSSCWIRYIEISEEKFFNEQVSQAITDIKNFSDLGIYKAASAKEIFEYQARTYESNYLYRSNITKGHSGFIVPKIYHDEIEKRDSLLFSSNNDAFNACGLSKAKGFNNINLRILLIDDKIGLNGVFDFKKSKAYLISELMKGCLFRDPKHSGGESLNLIWNRSNINIRFFSFVEENQGKFGVYKYSEKDTGIASNSSVIIQVANVAEAIYLLAKKEFKFDLVLTDYLLAENENAERELATNFFAALKSESLLNPIKSQEKALSNLCHQIKLFDNKVELEKVIKDIKENRGPVKKLWIFPITAYNDTLISDLVNQNIRLIDYYWHISKGADPSTTPYLFLSQLNNFLYLQLENSVFDEDSVHKFLQRTIEKLKISFKECFDESSKTNNTDNRKWYDFNALMASEYAVFVDRFMRRAEILKDKEKSLYAKYIWNNFYKAEQNQPLFKLSQYIQKFYHRCAYGTRADHEKMILFYKEMQAYIKHHTKEPGGKGLNRNIWSDSLSPFYTVLMHIYN